jgi:hypothetical protein
MERVEDPNDDENDSQEVRDANPMQPRPSQEELEEQVKTLKKNVEILLKKLYDSTIKILPTLDSRLLDIVSVFVNESIRNTQFWRFATDLLSVTCQKNELRVHGTVTLKIEKRGRPYKPTGIYLNIQILESRNYSVTLEINQHGNKVEKIVRPEDDVYERLSNYFTHHNLNN